MAKRKRLTPAQSGFLAGPGPDSTPRPSSPIAQVAGEAAAQAALQEMSQVLQSARNEGRLIQPVPLMQIVTDHLVRDRLVADPEDMAALKSSMIARGQQTPVEVTELPPGPDGQPRYGLISGWRRVQALRELAEERMDERFEVAQALIRQPADQADAYVAMVEENEIRADLSFFERARIVVKALEAGVFETEKQALQKLFSTASYTRRSKIKSFIPLVTAFDGLLKFPTALSERLGLQIARAIEEDNVLRDLLISRLKAQPGRTPEEEQTIIQAVMRVRARDLNPPKPPTGAASRVRPRFPTTELPDPDPVTADEDIWLASVRGKLVLSGPGVDSALVEDLKAWLKARG